MKTLIQVSIIVVLAFTLFQAISGVSMVYANTVCSSGTQSGCPLATASIQNLQVITCLNSRVGCVTPNVGWNT